MTPALAAEVEVESVGAEGKTTRVSRRVCGKKEVTVEVEGFQVVETEG